MTVPAIRPRVTFPTDFSGMAGTQYGPYVHYGQFINPVNRLAWVMSVAEMLPRPTGTTGWIYAPQTGEIRANLLGVDPFGRPWFKY